MVDKTQVTCANEADSEEEKEQSLDPDAQLLRFANWAVTANRWNRMNQIFVRRATSEVAKEEKRVCTTEDFHALLRRLGALAFDVDVDTAVELLKATRVPKKKLALEEDINFGHDSTLENVDTLLKKPEEPVDEHDPHELSQEKFKYFRRRCMQLEGLSPPAQETIVEKFVVLLQKKFGTVLKGYRTELDRRREGRVTYEDLAAFYRKYPSFGGSPKLVWNELHIGQKKGGGSCAQFDQLCPEEARNLEDFAALLWEKVSLDFAQLWVILDNGGLKYIDSILFEHFAQDIGFIGDCDLIFRGLSSGQGRLYLADFEYIGKVSAFARSKIHSGLPSDVAMFVNWVKLRGGCHPLFESLGLSGTNRDITVIALATRLEELGFHGGSLKCACWLARNDGGCHVTIDTLNIVTNGQHPACSLHAAVPDPAAAAEALRDGKGNGFYGMPSMPNHKQEQHVGFDRSCFGVKNEAMSNLVASLQGKSNLCHSARQRCMAKGVTRVAGWDNSKYDISEMNLTRCNRHRKLFSETSSKTVKEEVKAFLAYRRKHNVCNEWHQVFGKRLPVTQATSEVSSSELWDNDGDVPEGEVRKTVLNMWNGTGNKSSEQSGGSSNRDEFY